MLTSLRGYRPDDAVNRLSLAFDYAADLAAYEVADDMLTDARNLLAEREATIPARGQGQYPLVRAMTECELSRVEVMMLEGAKAQASAALAEYPAEVVEYAQARFPGIA